MYAMKKWNREIERHDATERCHVRVEKMIKII